MSDALQSFSLLAVFASAVLSLSGTAFAASQAMKDTSYFERLEQRIVSKFAEKEMAADDIVPQRSLSAYIPSHTFSLFAKKPTGCFVKGRITESSQKEYLVPGCPGFESHVVNPARNERMFCTEKHAMQAGWRKAENCAQ